MNKFLFLIFHYSGLLNQELVNKRCKLQSSFLLVDMFKKELLKQTKLNLVFKF